MNRRTLIITIGILAMFAALFLPRMRPTADAANRIREAYNRAEQPVLKPGSDLLEVERFARALRAIDLSGAPQEARDAMAAMIKAVEENAAVRLRGGNTNALNDAVADGKRDLLRALDKWRGQPF